MRKKRSADAFSCSCNAQRREGCYGMLNSIGLRSTTRLRRPECQHLQHIWRTITDSIYSVTAASWFTCTMATRYRGLRGGGAPSRQIAGGESGYCNCAIGRPCAAVNVGIRATRAAALLTAAACCAVCVSLKHESRSALRRHCCCNKVRLHAERLLCLPLDSSLQVSKCRDTAGVALAQAGVSADAAAVRGYNMNVLYSLRK